MAMPGVEKFILGTGKRASSAPSALIDFGHSLDSRIAFFLALKSSAAASIDVVALIQAAAAAAARFGESLG
jgi:hypothetical protein